MLFKLAWRNIWRNRRRTYITATSILFAVLLAAVMSSMHKGAWDNMVNNVVNYYFGYAQIHQQGYWDEQSLDKAFLKTADLERQLQKIPAIKAVLPRLEAFALASSGNETMGVLVVGIEPTVENTMTQLTNRLIKGAYLAVDDRGVLLSEGVLENLQLDVGDTLVLISQGYHGANAAGKYPVKGVLHFGSPELNKQMVYLPLPEAQWFFAAEGLVTSLTLKIDSPDELKGVVRELREILHPEVYEVMEWEEMLPDLIQAEAIERAGNNMVYFILYIIIAFGIFGTILMMMKERSYEFGVMIAIGMKRRLLAASIWLEIIFIGLLGSLAGILASIPVVGYFYKYPLRLSGNYAVLLEKYGFEPIFPAKFDLKIFMYQALVVFLFAAILAMYPFLKINRLQPLKAMRS